MHMKPYKNLSGHSGITSYEMGKEHIIVAFVSGDTYRFDYDNPGRAHVENMKYLAKEGMGLSTYISKAVKGNYADKL